MNRYAGVAVFCGNNILLAKKDLFYKGEPVPFGGYWSIFAGSAEPKEKLVDAAERELFEETGLTIEKPLSRIGKVNDLSVFATEISELENPNLNFEHTESGWFDVSILHSFPYKIDNKIVDLILKYKKNV